MADSVPHSTQQSSSFITLQTDMWGWHIWCELVGAVGHTLSHGHLEFMTWWVTSIGGCFPMFRAKGIVYLLQGNKLWCAALVFQPWTENMLFNLCAQNDIERSGTVRSCNSTQIDATDVLIVTHRISPHTLVYWIVCILKLGKIFMVNGFGALISHMVLCHLYRYMCLHMYMTDMFWL